MSEMNIKVKIHVFYVLLILMSVIPTVKRSTK